MESKFSKDSKSNVKFYLFLFYYFLMFITKICACHVYIQSHHRPSDSYELNLI